MTIREQLDTYVKEKYGVDPEVLPFSKEDYGVYRHSETGKWFAVFIVKDRSAFGLPGYGEVEVVSFKIRDRMLSDFVMQQPGYLRGFPASNWNWTTAVLDGTIPCEDICRWVDKSYEARSGDGAGLGMYIVRRFADGMNSHAEAMQDKDLLTIRLTIPNKH